MYLKNINISYIKSLINHFRLHYNTIANSLLDIFHSHYCNLIVSSHYKFVYIHYTLLISTSETTDTPFSRLFIRTYIDDLTAKRGKVCVNARVVLMSNTISQSFMCVVNFSILCSQFFNFEQHYFYYSN